MVRLELAIPVGQVLLFDPAGWDAVCDGGFLDLLDGEGDAWRAEAQMSGVDLYRHPLPEPWNGWMRQSWERIFDLEAIAAGGSGSTSMVHAIFERLDLAHVVAVTEFIERPEAKPRRGNHQSL